MEIHLHQCYWYASKFLGHPVPPSHLSSSWRPFLLARPFSPSLVSCSSNNFPRWDSNAESFRPRNFTSNGPRGKEREEQEQGYGRKRRWWSDEEREFLEDEEEISSGIMEEAIDGVWFLQVKLSLYIVSVSSPCLVFYLGLAKVVEELKEDFFKIFLFFFLWQITEECSEITWERAFMHSIKKISFGVS